jgi:hypothetical protein
MDFSILSIILLTSTIAFSATTVILAISLRKYQNLFFAEQVNSRKIVDEYEAKIKDLQLKLDGDKAYIETLERQSKNFVTERDKFVNSSSPEDKELMKDLVAKLTDLETQHNRDAQQEAELKKQIAELEAKIDAELAKEKELQDSYERLQQEFDEEKKKEHEIQTELDNLKSAQGEEQLKEEQLITEINKLKSINQEDQEKEDQLKTEINKLKSINQEDQEKEDQLKTEINKLKSINQEDQEKEDQLKTELTDLQEKFQNIDIERNNLRKQLIEIQTENTAKAGAYKNLTQHLTNSLNEVEDIHFEAIEKGFNLRDLALEPANRSNNIIPISDIINSTDLNQETDYLQELYVDDNGIEKILFAIIYADAGNIVVIDGKLANFLQDNYDLISNNSSKINIKLKEILLDRINVLGSKEFKAAAVSKANDHDRVGEVNDVHVSIYIPSENLISIISNIDPQFYTNVIAANLNILSPTGLVNVINRAQYNLLSEDSITKIQNISDLLNTSEADTNYIAENSDQLTDQENADTTADELQTSQEIENSPAIEEDEEEYEEDEEDEEEYEEDDEEEYEEDEEDEEEDEEDEEAINDFSASAAEGKAEGLSMEPIIMGNKYNEALAKYKASLEQEHEIGEDYDYEKTPSTDNLNIGDFLDGAKESDESSADEESESADSTAKPTPPPPPPPPATEPDIEENEEPTEKRKSMTEKYAKNSVAAAKKGATMAEKVKQADMPPADDDDFDIEGFLKSNPAADAES